MLGACSVIDKQSLQNLASSENSCDGIGGVDNGSISGSFYTNSGLKLQVVWTISSLIVGSARHYLLQPIISERWWRR
ncbi:hypothetical protein Hanom_Chr00s000003g01605681 [Helianthus anomalus]